MGRSPGDRLLYQLTDLPATLMTASLIRAYLWVTALKSVTLEKQRQAAQQQAAAAAVQAEA